MSDVHDAHAEAPDTSPDSRRSHLSLDDLSSHGDEREPTTTNTTTGLDQTTTSFGHDTQRVETKLKLNLEQQKEHYARQRKLFEDLRRDSVLGLSPSAFSSSSKSDDEPSCDKITPRSVEKESAEVDAAALNARSKKFQLQLQQMQQELTGGKKTQLSAPVEKTAKHRTSESDRDDVVDNEEIDRLQRKAKSIANYHSRIGGASGHGGFHYTRGTTTATRSKLSSRLDENETSNEALRKQLELLRRLQLENNRFRHENRSLREQNDVLEEQTSLHTREIKRLQDEISDLTLRIQHDQLELATAAQNARKMKQLQKQLSGLQSEKSQLQTALQEAMDQDAQLRLQTQNEIETLVQESKHLKRSVKQLKQQETKLQDQNEELKATVTANEAQLSELKRELLEAKRDGSEMASQLSEKTSRIEAIESSATQCVERMEAGMDALQKAHTAEREKRKKLEKTRDQLQAEMATLEDSRSKLQDRVHELELYTSQLQERLENWKLEKKRDQKLQDEKLTEFQDRQKSDAKTIGNLRDDCATFEQHLETARVALVEARQDVAAEANALRKELEALRNYVEDAQRAAPPSSAGDRAALDASNAGSLALDSALEAARRPRHDALWLAVPELQFLHGAAGALRNELLNLVNDLHRARHQSRQLGARLAAAQERVSELETQRDADAAARRELADARALAEQAREITQREKLEVLAWSQQACEKSERLEASMQACGRGVVGVAKRLRRAAAVLWPSMAADGFRCAVDEKAENVAEVVAAVDKMSQEFILKVEDLMDECKSAKQEVEEKQREMERLQRESEALKQDHVVAMREIETLHVRAAEEKQELFTSTLRAVEEERDGLNKALDDEREALKMVQSLNEALEEKMRALEQDAPVLVAIVQLFALVVPSLVLQVNDLLSQKRVLARENAELIASQEQVECIGQVLRELVPNAKGVATESYAEQQRRLRRKQFRRVVIVVFAINRFQRGGFTGAMAGTGESVYGVCASLKPAKRKKSSSSSSSSGSSSCLPPQTVIKVLPGKPLLSRLNMRKLLDRLRGMDLITKLGDALSDSCISEKGTSFGNLLVHVLTTIDPSSKETLLENTAGVFHCRALLERRKASGMRWHDSTSGSDLDEARLSTVDLIRKKILALGKRLEDLHYQRNSLQKENYDFQYQLDQQGEQLKEMSIVIQKNEELQDQLAQQQLQQDTAATTQNQKLAEKDREIETTQLQLSKKQEQLERLQQEIVAYESRVAELELEKTDLHRALLVAQAASAAEEEKLHKSRIGHDKQAEELRNLKQATKRAHELHQKVTWQLEQELIEKASLQSTMDHLRKQKEILELEVSRAKIRAVEDSFDAGDEESGDVTGEIKSSNAMSTRHPKSCENGLAISTSSSAASYERHIQELTDRIAQIRSSVPVSIPHQGDCQDQSEDELDPGVDTRQLSSSRVRQPDNFRAEWQRLDISRVFEDDTISDNTKTPSPKRSREGGDMNDSLGDRRRRGDEIDKVNSAVHDYMDRIDEKLQQMYGIPKSSSRQRPPTAASVIHGSTTRKAIEVRWGESTEFE